MNLDIDDLGTSKHRKLLSDLRKASVDPELVNIESSTASVHIPKSIEKESVLARENRQKQEDAETDSWLGVIENLTEPVFLKKAKPIKGEKFLEIPTKKEKKKKKKEKLQNKEPIDYEKVFETDDAAITNLMKQQSRFIESLQNEWDMTTQRKGSSRGVTKTTTEIATNISSARTLMMNLIKQKIDLKKTIADLTLKQQKELNQLTDEENSDLGYAGSSFIKQVVRERSASAKLGTDVDVGEIIDLEAIDGEDFLSGITLDDGLDSRSVEASKYLQYEVLEPTEYVVIEDIRDPLGYRFKVITKDGDDITDEYPLPDHSPMTYNESTGVATNELGQKFSIWQG